MIKYMLCIMIVRLGLITKKIQYIYVHKQYNLTTCNTFVKLAKNCNLLTQPHHLLKPILIFKLPLAEF